MTKLDVKPQEYVDRSERAAAEIATWPNWMQRNLTPPTVRVTDCEHRLVHASVFTEGPHANEVALWSCDFCGVRFYPACPTCVDVGHRNVEHPTTPKGFHDLADAGELRSRDGGIPSRQPDAALSRGTPPG